jgi:hypothetical protein
MVRSVVAAKMESAAEPATLMAAQIRNPFKKAVCAALAIC